jgi:hypothetical protein
VKARYAIPFSRYLDDANAVDSNKKREANDGDLEKSGRKAVLNRTGGD